MALLFCGFCFLLWLKNYEKRKSKIVMTDCSDRQFSDASSSFPTPILMGNHQQRRRSPAAAAAYQLAENRLAEWHQSGAAQRADLQREALLGALDIVDDYFDSCGSVVLFELWKIRRAALWTLWLDQLGANVSAYSLILDRQAFAGSLYLDASSGKLKALTDDQQRRHDLLSERSKNLAIFVSNLHVHPLYLSETAKPAKPVSRVKVAAPHTAATSTHGETRRDAPRTTTRSTGGFVTKVLDRMKGIREGNRTDCTERSTEMAAATSHQLDGSELADDSQQRPASRSTVTFT